MEDTPTQKNAKIEEDYNPLLFISYCAQGDLEGVKNMLDKGADPNEPVQGHLPLSQAEGFEIHKILLERGANPQKNMKFCVNPFGRVLRSYDPDLVRLYLKYGADPNLEDDSGSPPFVHLINANAFLVRRDESLERRNQFAKYPKLKECAEILLDAGAILNPSCVTYSNDILRNALLSNCYEMAEWLIDNGADTNLVNKYADDSILHDLSECGDVEAVNILLFPKMKSHILLCCMAREYDNGSFLYDDFICLDNFIDIMKLVYKRMANPHYKNQSGETALDVIRKKNGIECAIIAKYLESAMK